MHTPCCVPHVANAAGTPAPAVTVPAVYPSAAQQATQAALQPVWHIPYTARADMVAGSPLQDLQHARNPP